MAFHIGSRIKQALPQKLQRKPITTIALLVVTVIGLIASGQAIGIVSFPNSSGSAGLTVSDSIRLSGHPIVFGPNDVVSAIGDERTTFTSAIESNTGRSQRVRFNLTNDSDESANGLIEIEFPESIDVELDAFQTMSVAQLQRNRWLINVPKASGDTFSNTEVDTAGSAGSFPDLSVLESGTVLISYLYDTNNDLRLARTSSGGFDQSDWTTVTIDSITTVGSRTAVDAISEDLIYVAYHDAIYGDLKVAKTTQGGGTPSDWSLIDVDTVNDAGSNLSMVAVDSEVVFISHYNSTSQDLRLSKTTSGGDTSSEWTNLTIDSGGNVGAGTSIDAVDRDNVFVSYYDSTHGDLKFAKTSNGGDSAGDWTTVIVDSDGDVGEESSITAIDSEVIYISYLDKTNSKLKIAKTTTGGDSTSEWTTVVVDDMSTTFGWLTSAVATDPDTVFVSYFDTANEDLKVARTTEGGDTSSEWSSVTVDQSGRVGNMVAIDALDSNNLYVAYYDDTNDDLKFASSVTAIDPVIESSDDSALGFFQLQVYIRQIE